MKKLLYVIAVALCMVACESNTPNGGSITKGDYEDLGLTSGTKWKVVMNLILKTKETDFILMMVG